MRQYEMMYILHPQLSDEDLTAAIDQVGRYVTNLGGTFSQIIREAPWGRRRLAYTIRHNGQDLRDGFYVLSYFSLDNTRGLGEIERQMNLNDRVVRYLVVKVEERKQPEDKKKERGAKAAAEAPAAQATQPAAAPQAPATETPATEAPASAAPVENATTAPAEATPAAEEQQGA